MFKSRGLIELAMGVLEAYAAQQVLGRMVFGMVPGEESCCAEHVECMTDRRMRRFRCEALAPMRWAEMKAELEHAVVRTVWTKATAPDKSVCTSKEHRPVLQA